jgi:phosphohistidine swiveling domain-containing protein
MNMTKFLTRNYSFLGASLMMDAWRDADGSVAATGIPDVVRNVEYARTIWWLDQTWIESFSAKYLTAEPNVFRAFLRHGQEAGNKLTLVSRNLWEALDPDGFPSSEKNLQDFLSWEKYFHENATFLLVTHPLAKSAEVRLLDILKKYGVPSADLDQALLDLSITRKSNAAEEENFDLFVIQNRMSRPDFDLEAALEEHTRKHAYLKYRDPFSGGYTVDYFRERLKEKLELPNYFQPYADIIGQFQVDEKELVELQEEFVFYRTFRTERSYESLYYLERFLTALEESNGLGLHELSFYSKEELIRFLQSRQRTDLSEIENRRRDFVMLLHNGSVSVLTGGEARQWLGSRFVESVPRESEVRGLTAFRGSATGRARIVKNAADQDAVTAGDVLVVPMTTPDYLPSMQKAAAFVTDEGGVICHAAIIARELKKPCVIGTKKATSVFRDGDWVEVDGFTGIVRLIPSPSQTGGTEK